MSPYLFIIYFSCQMHCLTPSPSPFLELLHSTRSFSSRSPPRDEKDYFQVTDELSQENSHFSLSEALVAVIEQYKATRLEQQFIEEQFPPPSPLSPIPHGYTPLSSSPFFTPTDSSYLSSWGSMSSIATNSEGMHCKGWHVFDLLTSPPDLSDGRGTTGMTQVSLLELMQSQSCDHSAESTAQKLLQHIAGHMTGGMKDISQLVRNPKMSVKTLKLGVFYPLTYFFAVSETAHRLSHLLTNR